MLIFSLDESWERIAEFPSQPGAMCTALRFAGSKLLAAFSTGHVRVYDVSLAGCSLCAQINAHARWINALEVMQ